MSESAVREWRGVARGEAKSGADHPATDVPGPLVRALDAVPHRLRGTAANLGCGAGALLPALASRFPRVLAIDAAPAVLARARGRCASGRVTYHRAELTDLSAFHERVDVAVALAPRLGDDVGDVERAFAAIHGCLRPGGWLLGLFPAMEAALHRAFLRHERERRGGGRAGGPALPAATAEDEKRFYAFEVEHRLRQAGFARVRLGRVPRARDATADLPAWDWMVQAVASGPSGGPARRAS